MWEGGRGPLSPTYRVDVTDERRCRHGPSVRSGVGSEETVCKRDQWCIDPVLVV